MHTLVTRPADAKSRGNVAQMWPREDDSRNVSTTLQQSQVALFIWFSAKY